MTNVIKTAEEILDKYPNYTSSGGIGRGFAKEAMKEYAEQFIDLAVTEAMINVDLKSNNWATLTSDIIDGKISINKESILKIKELVK